MDRAENSDENVRQGKSCGHNPVEMNKKSISAVGFLKLFEITAQVQIDCQDMIVHNRQVCLVINKTGSTSEDDAAIRNAVRERCMTSRNYTFEFPNFKGQNVHSRAAQTIINTTNLSSFLQVNLH